MKAISIKNSNPIRKKLIYLFFLLCGLTLSSYKGQACDATFAYFGGYLNGHWSFTCIAAASQPGTLYSWNMGDGSGWQQRTSMGGLGYIYTANGTYNVKLAIQDSTCIDTATETITVTNVTVPCTLSAGFTASVGAHGLVTFTSTSTGTNANTLYYWSPGDGNQDVQAASTYTHTYLYRGTYGVWLILSDTGNAYCIDSVYETVYVGTADSSPCHLNATFLYTTGPNGHYTFTSTSTGILNGFTQYYWNPGDGSGWQYGNTPFTHTYVANGTYNVQLAVGDSTCIDTSAITLVTVSNVTTPCTLSANFNVSYGSGGDVTFTSNSGGTNANTLYYWSPGDSNQTYQEASTYTHKYLWDGRYYVWLTVRDTGSAFCVDSIEEVILVTNADSSYCHLHANFTYTLDTNGQVTFHSKATGTIPSSYYWWNLGDGSGYSYGYNDTALTYTFANNGTYSVTLRITSDSTFCNDSIVIPVTITNACNLNVNFTYQYDSTGQVQFTSTSTGVQQGAQYNWSFGDSTSVNGYDTATHDYSFIGYYNVTLTIVNPGGCTVSSTQTIYIYNKDSLQARFTYYSWDSLNMGYYYFTSTSLGTNNNTYYKWTPGDGSLPDSGLGMTTYQHTYTSGGPVSATLTIWYTVLPHKAIHHTPTPTGRYDESSYTLVINVTTGIQSITKNAGDYKVYPDPNNGSFKVAINGLTDDKNAEIRISNMMGQVIYQSNAAVTGGSTLSEINLPNAANGIYLLQIITAGNTYTSRIAIQK